MSSGPAGPAHVAVIGGGIGGASAALRLARAGLRVTLVEAAGELGGLVGAFSVAGTPLERYYHHVFPQESAIQALISELGLAARLDFLPSSVAVLDASGLHAFTTALDLLRFPSMPLADRLRTGVGAMRMQRARDWLALDDVPASTWLRRHTGDRAFHTVWEPLLRAKFGAAADGVPASWIWGRFEQRRGARGLSGRERLGYLRGGFHQLFERLADALADAGVQIRLGHQLVGTTVVDGRLTAMQIRPVGRAQSAAQETVPVDGMLFTAGLGVLAGVVAPEFRDPRWSAVARLGVLCVVLVLDRAVTPFYWTNVCDPLLGFGAVIEHTNLVPAADYGGRHVLYLARYYTEDDPLAGAVDAAEAQRWVDALRERLPRLAEATELERHVFRAPVAAPVVRLGQAAALPPSRSSIRGLHLATMAQVHPHDRGMNDAIELAAGAADALLAELGCAPPSWRCPVCGGVAGQSPWQRAGRPAATPRGAAECGVSAASFRPSSRNFGQFSGRPVRCLRCGHISVADPPDAGAVSQAYAAAVDPVSLRERAGRQHTAERALALLDGWLVGGRTERVRLLDVGCWTGSVVAGANRRGWSAWGIEPSDWAAEQARADGLEVVNCELWDAPVAPASQRAVTAFDVLEHLEQPAAALARLRSWLEPGGVLLLTVPDAGSLAARVLGRRWWSVLPMHLQYFTRDSMPRLLAAQGLSVLSLRSHPKTFSARYYAEQLAGAWPAAAQALTRLLELTGCSERLITPDLHDRMLVIARAAPPR